MAERDLQLLLAGGVSNDTTVLNIQRTRPHPGNNASSRALLLQHGSSMHAWPNGCLLAHVFRYHRGMRSIHLGTVLGFEDLLMV